MPLRFSGFPHNVPLEAASLGASNDEVLAEVLGYSADKIAGLVAEGVLYSNPDT
jgi:crotonobetainyl-CoA:carnitine CoA-transferase CaiB-like acyl-CoA transferase